MSTLKVFLITLLSIIVSLAIANAHDQDGNDNVKKKIDNTNKTVTYDGRSLIINGKRELLFSGSIHYTRSTPEVPSSSSNTISII